jgi:hypothetical protein
MLDLSNQAPTGPKIAGLLAAAEAAGSALLAVVIMLAPIAAATIVLTWHGLRGTNPGPAAGLLLKLVEMVLPRRRRR